jgi:hypothetical protein
MVACRYRSDIRIKHECHYDSGWLLGYVVGSTSAASRRCASQRRYLGIFTSPCPARFALAVQPRHNSIATPFVKLSALVVLKRKSRQQRMMGTVGLFRLAVVSKGHGPVIVSKLTPMSTNNKITHPRAHAAELTAPAYALYLPGYTHRGAQQNAWVQTVQFRPH